MPMQDKPIITSRDQVDFYKATTQQFALLNYPDVDVTFGYNLRSDIDMTAVVSIEQVREEIDHARSLSYTKPELKWFCDHKLEDQPTFTVDYIAYLERSKMPEVEVGIREDGRAFTLRSHGKWADVSPWETQWLNILNTLYFRGIMKREGISVEEAWREGDRRLSEKIAFIKERGIEFVEFGNRRAFSPEWQAHVDERLCEEVGELCLGISNIAFARRFGKNASGTYPHEGPLVLQGVYHDLDDQMGRMYSQEIWFDQWFGMYGVPLSVALADTYTTEYHLKWFGERRFCLWRAQRLDSGNLEADGELFYNRYRSLGIDPMTKTLIPSDGMERETILSFKRRFDWRIKNFPGWGTDLTNDLGFKAASHVAKPIFANGCSLVKVSNNPNKVQGDREAVARVFRLIGYDQSRHHAVECKY